MWIKKSEYVDLVREKNENKSLKAEVNELLTYKNMNKQLNKEVKRLGSLITGKCQIAMLARGVMTASILAKIRQSYLNLNCKAILLGHTLIS